jgi:hypothetical protein
MFKKKTKYETMSNALPMDTKTPLNIKKKWQGLIDFFYYYPG